MRKKGIIENKTGLQSGSIEPDCRPALLFTCDFTVLPGNPPDLASDLHGLPDVEGTGHRLQRCARRDCGDAAVAGTVARADVHLPPGGLDEHPDGGLPGDGLFLLRLRLRFRHGLLPGVVLRHSNHTQAERTGNSTENFIAWIHSFFQ